MTAPAHSAAFWPRPGPDEAAEALALTALAHLLADPDRTARLLGLTGLAGHELATHLNDPAFLGGVLDFVLADEALLLEIAGVAGLRPERVAGLRRRLPGAVPVA